MGGGEAARAARFAWPLANPGIGREENQQLRAGAHVAGFYGNGFREQQRRRDIMD